MFTRRTFLTHASALTVASMFRAPAADAAESPPEVKRIRLLAGPATCGAPGLIAEQLLLAEGFSDIEYVKQGRVRGAAAIAEGLADMSPWDIQATLPVLDAGGQVVVLAGIHAGCWQLFGSGRIHTLRDLKGKSVAIRGFGLGDHVLLASMFAYVGMDPHSDVKWLAGPTVTDALPLFVTGQAAAYMAFEPQAYDLRTKKVGHVILDTAQDRPWSQYYCCVMVAQRNFVQTYPIATKRALRAYLKATDICAQEPERVARMLAEKGIEPHYEVGLNILKSLPFDRWRETDPEDTMRFYALRLHEVGMIKAAPQRLIAQGSDWRFLNELKKELKA